MDVIPKENWHFMPFSLQIKPSGSPPQDLDTQTFHLLIVVLLFT